MKKARLLTDDQVREMLFEACSKLGSQRAFARKHHFSAAYVNDLIRGFRPPSQTICKILGVKRIITITFIKE